MSQAKDELVARAQDPNADLETLHQLAQNYPGLRPYIAANPRTYPALLEWLGTLGDPAVDAALASRSSRPQSAQSPQASPRLAVVSPPGSQPGSPSARSSEAPTQVTLPRSLQPGSAASEASAASAASATSSRSAASASSAFSTAGANTQVDSFLATGDPAVANSTFQPTQAIPSQSPARPAQPALQQTFQQSANVSQPRSTASPAATQAASASDDSASVFGVGTDDDSSAPSSFLTSNRVLLILAIIVMTILIFLVSWYSYGGSGSNSAKGSDPLPTTLSGQNADRASATPSSTSASPKTSATPSASATPTLKAPAPANARSDMPAFSAPSGNITCTLGNNDVTCVIKNHEETTSCPASRPLTVKIAADGQSTQSCGSAFTPSDQTLDYTESAKNDSFACTSTDSGMQCWSQVSGEGFTVNRSGVESTSHGR